LSLQIFVKLLDFNPTGIISDCSQLLIILFLYIDLLKIFIVFYSSIFDWLWSGSCIPEKFKVSLSFKDKISDNSIATGVGVVMGLHVLFHA